MQDLIAELANKANFQQKLSKYPNRLHLCYGKIGIPAVAAAARYQSVAKNAGRLPVVVEADYRRPAFG